MQNDFLISFKIEFYIHILESLILHELLINLEGKVYLFTNKVFK